MIVGTPIDRVEGRLKVTGAADYASDRILDDMLYGVPVGSTIAAGRVLRVDADAALAVPGVVAVFDHTNIGTLHSLDPDSPFSARASSTNIAHRLATTPSRTTGNTSRS